MLADLLGTEAFGYFLVFARMGALFMVAPALGETSIPANIRLVLALLVSFLVFLTVRQDLPAMPGSILSLAGLLTREILIGVMIGGATRLLLSALHVAGTTLAFQNSLAFSQQFDPSQGAQSAITASFLTILGIVLIFVTDMHLLLIGAARSSYELFPIAYNLPVADFAEMVVDVVAQSFYLGIQIAAPFIVFGLVFNVSLGLIARLMPQLPIFFVAMPLNIYMGFVILLIALPAMMMWFLNHFEAQVSLFLG